MTDGLAPAALGRFRRTGELYRKGILSEEDFIREMPGTLNGVFADFLKDARLELRLTA